MVTPPGRSASQDQVSFPYLLDLPSSMSLKRARAHTHTHICTPVPTPPCELDCLFLAWAVQGHPKRCSFRGDARLAPFTGLEGLAHLTE